MRDLNTITDVALLRRHSRLVAADLAERAKPPKVRQPVHAMCLAMSEVYQLAPAVTVIGVDLAKPGSDTTTIHQVDAQETRELVREKLATAAGVHSPRRAHLQQAVFALAKECRNTALQLLSSYGAKKIGDIPEYKWAQAISDCNALMKQVKRGADTPAIEDWRPGDQVPEGGAHGAVALQGRTQASA